MTFANSRSYHEHVIVYSESHELIGNATFTGKGVQAWIGGRGVAKIPGHWSWDGTLMNLDFKVGEAQEAAIMHLEFDDGVMAKVQFRDTRFPPLRLIIMGDGMPPRVTKDE